MFFFVFCFWGGGNTLFFMYKAEMYPGFQNWGSVGPHLPEFGGSSEILKTICFNFVHPK